MFLFSSLSHAKSCGKNYMTIQCGKISKAQRGDFCWKGKLDNGKKERICRSKPKNMAKISKKMKAHAVKKKNKSKKKKS